MPVRVFFSFDYARDLWRAIQVRNHWSGPGREATGFWDAYFWEATRKKGEAAMREVIDTDLAGASMTAVLIGRETAGLDYVKYALIKSRDEGRGILGIYINGMEDPLGQREQPGSNPMGSLFYIDPSGMKLFLSDMYRTYDWIDDGGPENLAGWIREAAKDAGFNLNEV